MSGWLVIRAVGEWIREVVGKYERLAVIYERLPAVPKVGEIPGRSEAWLITGKKHIRVLDGGMAPDWY